MIGATCDSRSVWVVGIDGPVVKVLYAMFAVLYILIGYYWGWGNGVVEVDRLDYLLTKDVCGRRGEKW